MKELTEAAARGATGPLTSAIVDLSKRLRITEDATKTLRIVGEQDVPLERLAETLNRVANDYKRRQAQSASDDPLRHGHALLIGISKYDDRRWSALEDVPLQVEQLRRGRLR